MQSKIQFSVLLEENHNHVRDQLFEDTSEREQDFVVSTENTNGKSSLHRDSLVTSFLNYRKKGLMNSIS